MAAGGKPRRAADKGKPLQTCDRNTPRQPKKTPGGTPLCRPEGEPDKGRAPRRGGRPRRRMPTRQTAPTRADKPTRPNAASVTPNDDGGSEHTASRDMNKHDDRAGWTRPAGRGRIRIPPSRGRANMQSRAHWESNNETSDSRTQGPGYCGRDDRDDRDDRDAIGRSAAPRMIDRLDDRAASRKQTIITRQARGDHSTGGNAEDGDCAPKRNPKGAGVSGAGEPPQRSRRPRAPPSLARRPRRMVSTSDRGRSIACVSWARAQSARARTADRLCLSGLRWHRIYIL